ncbi:MAG: NAD(+) synthase [Pirellulaceae bacterium]|nr:NAD(+) synthase [Pirellulaceae bacterium]
MKLIKTGSAVLNQTPLDWDGNQRRIIEAIERARAEEVTLLCLPELCITGYGCEDAFHSPGVQATALSMLEELIPHTGGMIVSLGLPVMSGGALFNTSCLVADGQLLGFVGKQNLAGEGVHYEPRWFKRWPHGIRDDLRIGNRSYPIGDVMFRCGEVLIGFEICEDAWVANRPGGELAQLGADIILNPSASHFAFGKHAIRRRFVLEGSRAFSVSYLYANLLGNESGRTIYDGDAMIASCGRMLANGPRFSFADMLLTTAVIDVDATRMNRSRTGSFRPVLGGDDDRIISAPFDFPAIDHIENDDEVESEMATKEEEFTHAVSLALFDYMRKSFSRGFVVSLSGGADSAAVATLCKLAVALAASDIGLDGVRRKLSYGNSAAQSQSADELAHQLLLCVYQRTRNSSETTSAAAAGLAAGLGAEFIDFDVDEIVEKYVALVEGGIGRELSWETDDIALQNIQARVRSPGVWMLANLRGALLLSTSNRSEAAVGYATMDGDTSGGLSPIAGIDKAFLRHWLRWMEDEGPAALGPVAALAAVNRQQPTAELRPQDANQTDEDDLMPYDVLDIIERAAIRDKLTPREVLRRIEPELRQYSRLQLGGWVERFFRLWCRNQWKRERYAPSFHLDDENLDPKTWCRFPILSGGYRRELQALRAELAAESEADHGS